MWKIIEGPAGTVFTVFFVCFLLVGLAISSTLSGVTDDLRGIGVMIVVGLAILTAGLYHAHRLEKAGRK